MLLALVNTLYYCNVQAITKPQALHCEQSIVVTQQCLSLSESRLLGTVTNNNSCLRYGIKEITSYLGQPAGSTFLLLFVLTSGKKVRLRFTIIGPQIAHDDSSELCVTDTAGVQPWPQPKPRSQMACSHPLTQFAVLWSRPRNSCKYTDFFSFTDLREWKAELAQCADPVV